VSEIPEDIREAAQFVFDACECILENERDDLQAVDDRIDVIARAILAERKASVEAVLDALLAHELYQYRPSAFKGFVAYARETFCPEFRDHSQAPSDHTDTNTGAKG
jgi:hypothetical protein